MAATTSDLDFGKGIIRQYADVAGINAQTLLDKFSSNYGDDGISEIGQLARTVNQGSLSGKFIDISNHYLPPTDPYSVQKVDLVQAFLDLGAIKPSFTAAIVKGTEDSAVQVATASFSVLKYAAILSVAALAFYAVWELGWIKKYAAKVRPG